jgi:DNA (cytosine-5)-methyltransferase 1
MIGDRAIGEGRIGSVFSGIGGGELGLERAGLGRTVFQLETDPFCIKVLAKHWPEIPGCRLDIRRALIDYTLPKVDVLIGGFPCTGLSPAGRRRGLADPKSALWSEFNRIIPHVAAGWIIIENSHHGWRNWVPYVRKDLLESGFHSVPVRLSAAEIGAPHLRRRAFVIAHTDGKRIRELSRRWRGTDRSDPKITIDVSGWTGMPGVARARNGIPDRVDRNRALGNAIVPQVTQVIGHFISAAESSCQK